MRNPHPSSPLSPLLQMLRGAVIIFTGILSTIFLRARLAWFKWFGMVFVIGGLVTVGLSDMLNQKPKCHHDTNSTIQGHHSQGYALVLSPVSFTSSSVCSPDNSSSLHNVLLGDILIFGSQVILLQEETATLSTSPHPGDSGQPDGL